MNGIIILNKPKDYTSFDVVAVMRKLLSEKKIGHAGTLDPMATGVLPILIGRATKLQAFIAETNKEYLAKFKLGIVTDTLDITGKVLSSTLSKISKDEIEKILPEFFGEIYQIPPMFSAVQKNGIRLYKLARKGIEIAREPRKIIINELKLLNFDETSQCGELLIDCSKGTYIRTLCDDIGKKLGCGAVLTELKRTKTSNFKIENSLTLDDVRKFVNENVLDKHILPCDSALENYARINISELQTARFKNGGRLSLDRISTSENLFDGEILKVYSHKNNFIGLGKVNFDKNLLSVECLIEI